MYFYFIRNEKKLDFYNLIESGLLFKKDSTNLWSNPMAQVITNINYQHQEWVNQKLLMKFVSKK